MQILGRNSLHSSVNVEYGSLSSSLTLSAYFPCTDFLVNSHGINRRSGFLKPGTRPGRTMAFWTAKFSMNFTAFSRDCNDRDLNSDVFCTFPCCFGTMPSEVYTWPGELSVCLATHIIHKQKKSTTYRFSLEIKVTTNLLTWCVLIACLLCIWTCSKATVHAA